MASKEFMKIKVRVLEAAGGRQALADKLGITPPAISQWDRVPAERIGQVAAATGMRPEEIRPDLFGIKATA